MNNQKYLNLAAIVLVALAGGWLLWRSASKASDSASTPTPPSPISEQAEQPATTNDTASTLPTESLTMTNASNDAHRVTITTNLGDIVFLTYDGDATNTVNNFIELANKGFYNGVIFHRVISGFMIQGGDPTGTGTGGPGYKFADELNPSTESYQRGYVRGTVAMANAGPNTNGSQFFIMHEDYPLQHDYTIFGHVIEGQNIVDQIASVPVDGNDKPLQPITMTNVKVESVE